MIKLLSRTSISAGRRLKT